MTGTPAVRLPRGRALARCRAALTPCGLSWGRRWRRWLPCWSAASSRRASGASRTGFLPTRSAPCCPGHRRCPSLGRARCHGVRLARARVCVACVRTHRGTTLTVDQHTSTNTAPSGCRRRHRLTTLHAAAPSSTPPWHPAMARAASRACGRQTGRPPCTPAQSTRARRAGWRRWRRPAARTAPA